MSCTVLSKVFRWEDRKQDSLKSNSPIPLPFEILPIIFSHLTLHDAGRMGQVSRAFKELVWTPLSSNQFRKTAERAQFLFVPEPLKKHFHKHTPRMTLGEFHQLPKQYDAIELASIWLKLAEAIKENVDLDIQNPDEFPKWCETHKDKLKTVKELNLSSLGLTSLPKEIRLLTGLKTLSIQCNQLTSLPPEFKNSEISIYCDEALYEFLPTPSYKFYLFKGTLLAIGGEWDSNRIHSDLFWGIDKTPVISMLGGIAHIVASVALIAFNTLKLLIFGIAALGALCLSHKKARLMQIGVVDSIYAIGFNIFFLGFGLVFAIGIPRSVFQ